VWKLLFEELELLVQGSLLLVVVVVVVVVVFVLESAVLQLLKMTVMELEAAVAVVLLAKVV